MLKFSYRFFSFLMVLFAIVISGCSSDEGFVGEVDPSLVGTYSNSKYNLELTNNKVFFDGKQQMFKINKFDNGSYTIHITSDKNTFDKRMFTNSFIYKVGDNFLTKNHVKDDTAKLVKQ